MENIPPTDPNSLVPTPVKGTPTGGNDIFLDIDQSENVSEIKKTKEINLLDLYERINDWMIEHSPIKFEEKLLFFQLLTTIADAGVGIPEALKLLYQQMDNPAFKKVIMGLEKLMNRGDSFADALSYYPKVFDEATCSIVRAGENSGKMSDVLRELVKQFERFNKIQKKAKGVMMYPVIVIIVMALLLVVVMTVVVPKLEGIFGGSDNLPLPTRIMIGMSDFFINQWYIIIIGLAAMIGGFVAWIKSAKGKIQIGNIVLRIPVIGGFVKKMVLSRITRIMGFLISAGVPIIDSVTISADVSGNPVYRRKMLLAGQDLSRGIEISENFADDEHLFPSMLVRMMSIGERTSSLGTVLGKLADYYDEELEREVGTLSKLMEPIILVFMAVGAVFMILAIYLPILQLNDQVTG